MQDQRSKIVYLDLQHEYVKLITTLAGSEATVIHCTLAGRNGYLLNMGLKEPRLAYCGHCMDLFDPEDECLKIKSVGISQYVEVITLVH